MISKKIYLTNHSFDEHDSINYRIFINDNFIIQTSYKNQYISHHWADFVAQIPKDTFKLRVVVKDQEVEFEKDTLMKIDDEESIFIRYNFRPSPDKLMNKEISERWEGKTNLNAFADSLYKHSLIDKIFLHDTIPNEKYIHISTAVVKEEIK